jgi:hypothetical protein
LKSSDRVFRWLLLLEEYGVTFEYLPGKKNVVGDALSRLDIDDLKIQDEEALILLSEAQISNIKFPMHTALIFIEQTRVNGLREKGLTQPQFSMQHIEGYDLLCDKDKIYIPHSLREKVSYFRNCKSLLQILIFLPQNLLRVTIVHKYFLV